jgi:hypothetical protein
LPPGRAAGGLGGVGDPARDRADQDSVTSGAAATGEPPSVPRAPSYDDRVKRMNGEDLIEIERAGRRCAVCRSGRGWRRLEVVRPPGSEPVLLCGSCRARFGDDPPIGCQPVPEPTRSDASPVPPREPPAEKGQTRPGQDAHFRRTLAVPPCRPHDACVGGRRAPARRSMVAPGWSRAGIARARTTCWLQSGAASSGCVALA